MALHIPGMAPTETWFGANWVEGRKNGRPFFMNVITGETTHVRPRIQHQEQIAALTADQVLGDLPIQTPHKIQRRGLDNSNNNNNNSNNGSSSSNQGGGGGGGGGGNHGQHGSRGSNNSSGGRVSSNPIAMAGGGSGASRRYAGAGAGLLYVPGDSPGGLFASAAANQQRQGQQHPHHHHRHDGREVLDSPGGGGGLSSDDDEIVGHFDDLDLVDHLGGGNGGEGVSLGTTPPFGSSFPPRGGDGMALFGSPTAAASSGGLLSPGAAFPNAAGEAHSRPQQHAMHHRAGSHQQQHDQHHPARQRRPQSHHHRRPHHSRPSREDSGQSTGSKSSQGVGAAKGNESSATATATDDATRKRRRRTAERQLQRKQREEQREQTILKLGEQVQTQQQQIAVLTAENSALKQQIQFLQDLVKNSMQQQQR